MAGSAAAFHRGDIAIYQAVLSRPNSGDSGLALTRNDWYAPHSTARFEDDPALRLDINPITGHSK